MSGSTVAVGSSTSFSGSNMAYVYYGCSSSLSSSSSSTCNDNNRVTLAPPSSADPTSEFSWGISVSGDTIAVGAFDVNNNTGAAYIYYGTISDTATPSGTSNMKLYIYII
jgi:hypothetical protein